MKNRNHLLLIALLVSLVLTGCKAEQRYLYVEDAPHNTPIPISNNYDATIYPNDLLYIYVSSQSPESVKRFNQETNTTQTVRDKSQLRGYTVSQSGHIIFPILGRIEVAGQTRSQLERRLESMLIEGGYVTDPVVTVNLMNFHVTVIGEVQHPRVVLADGSRLTIFEALAQCGDITIDGLRTNVVVVRSGVNTQTVDTIDLTRKEIFSSPYYYLQQNDIIFVEPTEKKKRTAWRNEDWPKYLNIGVQSLRVAYTTIYYIQYANKK
ncbi:MAG: polysaccharide biosynthesis/export family protein [Bacteroidales bacterium]|nr:polysaccharide biosynthesis/export family protein [Bacteroidales bacterium]